MLMVAYGGNDGVCTVIFPVQRVHIPLDGIIAAFGSGADHIVVIVPVGRTKQEHIVAGQLLHLLMDADDFLPLFIVGKLAHVFVVLAVIPQIVTGLQNGLHVVRIGVHPASRHEKGDMHVMPGEDIQNFLCILVSPGCVEGESDLLFLCLHTVDGKLSPVDGAGNGNRFRNEGGDAFDKDDDADKEQSRLDELHPDDGLIIFHFTEPFYPALYEIDKIFPHKI